MESLKPCKRGHTAGRYKNGTCKECGKAAGRKSYYKLKERKSARRLRAEAEKVLQKDFETYASWWDTREATELNKLLVWWTIVVLAALAAGAFAFATHP